MASEAKKWPPRPKRKTQKKSGNELHRKKTSLGKKNPFSFPREVIFPFSFPREVIFPFSFPREVFFLTFFGRVLLEMGGNGRGMCF